MTTIMIVEDDASLRRALTTALHAEGYQVVEADAAEQAVRMARRSEPDLVLLDLALPRADGFHVLDQLRSFSAVPVVVVTVREDKADKIRALDAGADDYVVKPFDADELLARVRAALRRRAGAQDLDPKVRVADLEIDLARGVVSRGSESVHLTPTELRFLELLVRSDGRLLRHREVATYLASGGDRPDAQTLRVYVAQLRRKLHDDAANPRLILTHYGLGYRWIAGEEPISGGGS